jgi:hypothetical protein
MIQESESLLAKLCLVASDAAYRRFADFGTEERLAPRFLSGLPGEQLMPQWFFPAGENIQWQFVNKLENPATGFGVVIYRC